MQVDFAIELAAEDDRLELPWEAADGSARYYDLKRRPELLLNVPEAFENRELGEFLAALNSHTSMLETAKCDAWASQEILPEEEIFGAAFKFGSYVDLLFSEPEPRFSLERHEELARAISALLGRAPEISAAAEFVVRRCFYHQGGGEPDAGFYVTFYLYGYGDDEQDARQRWSIALRLVQNALLQLSARARRGE